MIRRIVLLPLVAACSSSSSSSPSSMMMNPQNGQPPVFVQPNTLDVSTMKPANFACLGSHADPPAPTAPTALTVHVIDFETKADVAGATVEVYTSLDKFDAKLPDATSTATGSDGKAQLTVPPGSYRVIFRTVGDPDLTVETIEFNRAYDDVQRYSVSQATKGTIGAVLNLFPDDSEGVVAGAVRDCDDHDVGGATFGVSSSGGSFDSATNTFYFVDVSATSTVPERTQHWTSADGVFASLNVPPGDATVSAQGIVSAGAMPTMLATGVAPVRAAAVTVVELQPLGPP